MKQIAAILSLACLVALTAAAVRAQSLADFAEQERLRRETIGENPEPITNKEAAVYTGGSVSVITFGGGTFTEDAPAQADPQHAAGADASRDGGEADPDEPTDFEGRTEGFWRETVTGARQKVEELEKEATVLQLRMNDLETRFYSIDDGFDRDAVQKEIQKTFYEIDLNKENLAKAQDELADLLKEARSSGALPGWTQ